MLVIRARQDRTKLVLGILAAGWLWTGIVYRLIFFWDQFRRSCLWRGVYPPEAPAGLDRDFPRASGAAVRSRRRKLGQLSNRDHRGHNSARHRLAVRRRLDRCEARPARTGGHRGIHARHPDHPHAAGTTDIPQQGDDDTLEKRTRAHANFAEYVPLALILLAGAAIMGAHPWFLHAGRALLCAGRLGHAGAILSGTLKFRVYGMLATFLLILAASGHILVSFAAQL